VRRLIKRRTSTNPFLLTSIPQDKSNGYEEYAEAFMAARNPCISPAITREWSLTLPRACSILDLGCGHGVPISEALIGEGFGVYGVDASAKMVGAFRRRFPEAHAQCASVEESDFLGRTFDGVVASGLMFLLSTDVQALLIHKVAGVKSERKVSLYLSPRILRVAGRADRARLNLTRITRVRANVGC
jgi:2-polyprenyl-3-methyl-5-hydroxy-6-metoxy-1,4-benzoquinol methylase